MPGYAFHHKSKPCMLLTGGYVLALRSIPNSEVAHTRDNKMIISVTAAIYANK